MNWNNNKIKFSPTTSAFSPSSASFSLPLSPLYSNLSKNKSTFCLSLCRPAVSLVLLVLWHRRGPAAEVEGSSPRKSPRGREAEETAWCLSSHPWEWTTFMMQQWPPLCLSVLHQLLPQNIQSKLSQCAHNKITIGMPQTLHMFF